MLLTAFILTQLALDAILAGVAVACLLRLRSRPRVRPTLAVSPSQQELVHLARELLEVTEAAIEAFGRPAPAVAPLPAPVAEPAPVEPAAPPGLRLVRDVAAPAPRAGTGPLPGELRLVENVAAARAAAARAED
jgi:hypothetical protein